MTDEINPPPPAQHPTSERCLTPGVLGVGAASLFSDSSHEMVTSLLPTFLTSTLGGGPATLGAIDGDADALTGLAKLAGGPLAIDPARPDCFRRLPGDRRRDRPDRPVHRHLAGGGPARPGLGLPRNPFPGPGHDVDLPVEQGRLRPRVRGGTRLRQRRRCNCSN